LLVEEEVDPDYVWSPSLLHNMGLPQLTKDGKPVDLGNEFPMEKARRVKLLKGLPDIRAFRDLTARSRLPDDPEEVKHLSEGERFWITQAGPAIHRQLVQLLSLGAFLAQESAASMLGDLADGSFRALTPDDHAELCSSLVVLTMDTIRTLVDFQRTRLLKAGGRKAPLSVAENQRKIISPHMEDTLLKETERQIALKLAQPTLLAQVAKAVKGGSSGSGGPRRHRYARFRDIKQGYGRSRTSYDPEVNSTTSSYSSSSQPQSSRFSSYPYTKRGRGRGKFRGGRGTYY
jgi:hypothetical protein